MRILLLSNLYPPYVLGGAEIVARDYAVKLLELGHEVTVLTSSYGIAGPERAEHILRTLHYTPAAHFDRGKPVWRQSGLLSNYYHYFHHPASVKELQRVIAETRPDVLYIWEITGLGMNSLLQALHEVHLPVVFHLESYWLQYALTAQTEQTRLRTRRLKKLLIGNVPPLHYTSIIAASEAVKREYAAAGCDPERIEVIYNGIDARFLDTPRSQESKSDEAHKVRLIYVGRLCDEKGVHIILKALDLLVNEQGRHNFHLNIFGEGDAAYIKELHTFLNEKHLSRSVTFHGKVPQDQLIREYDLSTIMLIPSIWKEPFGLVIAEGMARGLPVITSNIGGPAEIVTHGVDGLLTEPGDVQAVAASIVQLADNPGLRARLAQAARATVQERFMIEKNAQRVEAHLQRAIQSDRKPAEDFHPRQNPHTRP
ncbi:MAG TPA: glycosyltransferase [Ktedonobacteraceae bacterium]|nr:glycosyltransferase [Ktedonobacteraceae bacterium]